MKPRVAAVDKPGMSECNLLSDSLNEQNLLVLQAYAERSQAAKAADQEHDGWLDRLTSASEIDAEQLTQIHGELIALGMLKFELTNRETGLRYRISDRGRATLERQILAMNAESEDCAPEAATTAADEAQITEPGPLADAA